MQAPGQARRKNRGKKLLAHFAADVQGVDGQPHAVAVGVEDEDRVARPVSDGNPGRAQAALPRRDIRHGEGEDVARPGGRATTPKGTLQHQHAVPNPEPDGSEDGTVTETAELVKAEQVPVEGEGALALGDPQCYVVDPHPRSRRLRRTATAAHLTP